MKVLKVIVLALIIAVSIYIINFISKQINAGDSKSIYKSSDNPSSTQENISSTDNPTSNESNLNADYNIEINKNIPIKNVVNAEENLQPETILPSSSHSVSPKSGDLKQYLVSKNVKSFKILDLSNFDLNDTDIKYLLSLEELENLYLSESNLFESEKNSNPVDLSALFQKLKVLKITNSKLTYENLHFICTNAKNLEHLDISHNPNVLDKYKVIPNLFELLQNSPFLKLAKEHMPPEINDPLNLSQQSNIDYNSFIEEISEQIDRIVLPETLKTLTITHSNINIFQLENLKISGNLKEIDLSSNILFTGNFDKNSLLFDFHQFKCINLSNCGISNLSFVQYLFESELLEKLDLSSNPVSIDFNNLNPSKSINILNFSNCQNLLFYMDARQTKSLSNIQIKSDTLKEQNSLNFTTFILKLENLKELNIKGIDAPSSLIEHLEKLKNLKIINSFELFYF